MEKINIYMVANFENGVLTSTKTSPVYVKKIKKDKQKDVEKENTARKGA